MMMMMMMMSERKKKKKGREREKKKKAREALALACCPLLPSSLSLESFHFFAPAKKLPPQIRNCPQTSRL